jgi:hypothetical protein
VAVQSDGLIWVVIERGTICDAHGFWLRQISGQGQHDFDMGECIAVGFSALSKTP